MSRLPPVLAAAGIPGALFTVWQLGPAAAAPFTAPWLVYSLFVAYLRLAERGRRVR